MIFGVPWSIAGIICIAISVIYFFIWPKELVSNLPQFQFIILRWFHSLVWILLAISFFLRYIKFEYKNIIVDGLGYAALLVYVIFIVTFLLNKF